MRVLALLMVVSFFSVTAASAVPPPTDPDGVALPARIDAIEIHGLVRTKKRVVLRELPWQVGTVVSQMTFDLGIARLWDTSMFSRVAGRVIRRGATNVAVIDLEERFPIRPIVEFQTGGNTGYIDLGISDRNILGEYLESEVYVQDFGGHWGGSLWFRDARLFDRRLELYFLGERVIRSRPNYLVNTTHGRLELNLWVMRDLIKFGTGIDARDDVLLSPKPGSVVGEPSPVHAAIFEPMLRIGRIDTVRLRERGVSLQVVPSLGVTSIPGAPAFRRLTVEGNAKIMSGERWNVDLRAQFGLVTNEPNELQFFMGGLDLLRGYPDNYFQANACVITNADVKFVLLDSKWLGLLPEAFSDGAAIRRTDGTTDAAFSVGAGIIFVVPKLVDTLLRVDVGVPLRPPYKPGVSTGTQVFF
ncbi:MAG TPA: hypothetical protein VEK07_03460 [Polyangiaceae bacterium]|nr:hypothetical protein [Polyangiaceae bacterium]